MGMPQIEAYENRDLWMKTGKGASHFCYRGVAADLIHFMAESLEQLLRVSRVEMAYA
jgi:hypothetical protein